MRNPFFILSLILFVLSGCSDSIGTNNELENRIHLLEEKAALKALVDEFSNLADVKDVEAQMDLFTDSAIVRSSSNGNPGSTLTGKEEIGNAFSSFLANFETVYHINGQQSVEIDGNSATGIAYCLVVLISNTDGNKTKRTMGVRYNDEYVKKDGKWLIHRRHSDFMWTEVSEM